MPRRSSASSQPVVSLIERFDYAALDYIIKHFDDFDFSRETDKSEMLTMIKKYIATARPDGTRRVSYRHATHGHGRAFAEGGLSLQGMTREIRNAIAYPFYDDIDFHNCHPTLLLQHCQKKGVPCPHLEDYCQHRDDVLASIDPTGAHGKAAVLAVINGGSSDVTRRGIPEVGAPWLSEFADEMRAVREAVVDAEYLDLARKTRGSDGGSSNILGSAVNMLLCDLEHKSLMALREYIESDKVDRRVGVLVFDGCMVEKKPGADNALAISREVLQAASDHIYARTGYRLRITIKDMLADKLDVPLSVYGNGSGVPRMPRVAVNDAMAAMMFLDDVAPIARRCMGRIYVREGVCWTDEKDIVDKVLLARCLMANIVRPMGDSDRYADLSSNVPSAKRIVTAAEALMPNEPSFAETMWRSNIGVLCFRNGLYDFRRRHFFAYDARPDVLPRLVVDRDFPVERPSQALMDEVRERLLLSTLGDPEVVETYLQLMARAAAGEYVDKQWVIMLGERDCGKGLLQKAHMEAWGPYVNTINANAFLLQQLAAGDAAKALSWAVQCEYTRMTYTNEVKVDSSSRAIKLDGNMIKSFQSGGDAMNARRNHENERTFFVATKLIMNLNDVPEITPRDAVSTLVLLKFPYKFVGAETMHGPNVQPYYRLCDETLKSEFCARKDVVDAFTWLVIDAYRDGAVVPCAKVREDTSDYREDVGDDHVLMSKYFKVTKRREDFVLVRDLKRFLVGKNVSLTVAKDRLKKMGANESVNCCVGGIKHGRGFTGVELVYGDDDD